MELAHRAQQDSPRHERIRAPRFMPGFRSIGLALLLPRLAMAHDEAVQKSAEADPDQAAAGDAEAVVIVHGHIPTAQSASRATITERQIEAAPIRTADDALRLTPGITLVQHGSEGK